MRDFLPEAINDHGFVKVRSTLQIDASNVSPKRFSEKLDRIYPIGDVSFSVSLNTHVDPHSTGPPPALCALLRSSD